METKTQIESYISSQATAKGAGMHAIHSLVLKLLPPADRLWFLDGKDEDGKTVSNPSIGYGCYIISYANGKTKEFYKIGMSANTSGISVYILGIEDKKYLNDTYAKQMGKASISSYCIKFKSLKDINIAVLEMAIKDGLSR